MRQSSLLIGTGLLLAGVVQADRLVYEGLPFDFTEPPYEVGDRVTAIVEVDGEILPGATILREDVISFSISDGQRTFTPRDSYFADFSSFAIENPMFLVDSAGEVTNWRMEVYSPGPPLAVTSPLQFIRTYNLGTGGPFFASDDTVVDGICTLFADDRCISGSASGDGISLGIFDMPGTWRILGEGVFASGFERGEGN
jgi:hypothetical protein